MNRIIAIVWAAAALFIGFMALKIALGPKGDASGWVLTAVFVAVAVFCGWSAWKDWRAPAAPAPKPLSNPGPMRPPAGAIVSSGLTDIGSVPLEDQIEALGQAGLPLAPGRSVEELLHSWPREDYETDPYNLLLFMYGSEVEAEPWGRWFNARGWNFDMECLTGAGDYVRALEQVVRITGEPGLVADLTDDFSIDVETATIRYRIGGQPRVLKARVDNDWADPAVVAAFLRDLEQAIGDGRRFWAADNGQASVLFFLTDAEAARINSLRPGLLEHYVA